MFNNHKECPMFHGSCGRWQMDPNLLEKGHHRGHHHHYMRPDSPQMWCYMKPMHHERWHHEGHKPHFGCPSRKPWEHKMNHHEMNPHKFKEMFHHMYKMKDHSKKNIAKETSHHHRHGFHW